MHFAAEGISEQLCCFGKQFCFFCRRRFVNTVHQRRSQPEYMLGYRFIGKQHEFLNDMVGHGNFVCFNGDGAAVFIQLDLGFREVEIKAAPCLPFLV